MNYQENIKRIKEKFEKIGIDIKKAFNPVLEENEILAFEKKHQITLPEDYRLFLMEIGNGINRKDEGGWQLHNAALNISQLDDTLFKNAKPHLPFPFTIDNPDRNSFLDPNPNGYINNGFNDIMYDGYLAVSDQGCCLYVALVVSGKAYGQIWHFGEHWVFECVGNGHPEEWNEGKRPCSFLEWFEGWFDSSVKYQKKWFKNNLIFRKLEIHELEKYHEIRLECLKNFPENFGTLYEEEIQHQNFKFDKIIPQNLPNDFLMGAFLNNDFLVGICGITQEKRTKTQHICEITQMYVRHTHKGLGIGKSLLKTTTELVFQNPQIEQIILAVMENNQTAKKLYENLGFEEYGKLKNYFKHNNEYQTQVFMVLQK